MLPKKFPAKGWLTQIILQKIIGAIDEIRQ